jgi:hypothetical protein
MFVRDRFVIPYVIKEMTSFREQARCAKMTLHEGKLTALACHLTKKLNKFKELIYLSISIEIQLVAPPPANK